MMEYTIKVFHGAREESYTFFADIKDAEPLLRSLVKGIGDDYMLTGRKVKSLHYEAEKFEKECE